MGGLEHINVSLWNKIWLTTLGSLVQSDLHDLQTMWNKIWLSTLGSLVQKLFNSAVDFIN